MVCVCMCECRYRVRKEDGIRSPVAGATGSCETPSVGAENRTWVLWNSSKNSEPLIPLPPLHPLSQVTVVASTPRLDASIKLLYLALPTSRRFSLHLPLPSVLCPSFLSTPNTGQSLCPPSAWNVLPPTLGIADSPHPSGLSLMHFRRYLLLAPSSWAPVHAVTALLYVEPRRCLCFVILILPSMSNLQLGVAHVSVCYECSPAHL